MNEIVTVLMLCAAVLLAAAGLHAALRAALLVGGLWTPQITATARARERRSGR